MESDNQNQIEILKRRIDQLKIVHNSKIQMLSNRIKDLEDILYRHIVHKDSK